MLYTSPNIEIESKNVFFFYLILNEYSLLLELILQPITNSTCANKRGNNKNNNNNMKVRPSGKVNINKYKIEDRVFIKSRLSKGENSFQY
jgi:hypothetical protein